MRFHRRSKQIISTGKKTQNNPFCAFADNKIPYSDILSALNLPPIRTRSELLYQAKKDLKWKNNGIE